VRLLKEAMCPKCRQSMEAVAHISPRTGEPGLAAYLCPACGAAHSDLVYPEHECDHNDSEEER
jgi:C4-type Zn-finger protein